MTDLYLSFPDEAAAKAVLYRIEGAQDATDTTPAVEGYEVPNYANIDTIGTIYERQIDPTATPVALPGWHVNVRVIDGEDEAALLPYAINVASPMRVWA